MSYYRFRSPEKWILPGQVPRNPTNRDLRGRFQTDGTISASRLSPQHVRTVVYPTDNNTPLQ
jgi:hypothetical protein